VRAHSVAVAQQTIYERLHQSLLICLLFEPLPPRKKQSFLFYLIRALIFGIFGDQIISFNIVNSGVLQYRERVHICDEGQHVRAYRIVSASSKTDFILNGEISAYNITFKPLLSTVTNHFHCHRSATSTDS